MHNTITVNAVLHTACAVYGQDLGAVHVQDIFLSQVSPNAAQGLLDVHYDAHKGDAFRTGIVYDNVFIGALRYTLQELGYNVVDIDYAPPAYQNAGTVRCVVGPKFLTSYKQKHPVLFEEVDSYFNS